ncbi:hypothetical protein [Bacillus sp. 165]|uniref:hypothetical protein n=1 Tax=Bacillus sp. 165 TaxID=1529117 RepID=UPI001ADA558A|nr:hypothetical protein [Bacillus sp. 165]MBO9129882.1 hypothetical protein [Bacillus sp. 165]
MMNISNHTLDSFVGFYFGDIKIPIIAVYENPADFPGKYVARLFDLQQITNYIIVKDTLAEIRECIPSAFNKMPRSQEDDPTILEIWM